MNTKKSTVLFLLHLPPPIHGSAIVGEQIYISKKINDEFNVKHINILVSRHLAETGKGNIIKLFRTFYVWFKLLGMLFIVKPAICYFALTTSGFAFYKDVVMVGLLRLFKVKCIYHLHNKGVKNQQSNKVYSTLYRFVFKDSDVILLSKLLYSDIEKFVPESNIYICPNGLAEDGQMNLVPRVKALDKIPSILFLSNLIESKGVFVLLEACKLLVNKNIDFNCNFIGGEGDITTKQLIEKIFILGLEKKVNYLGKKYGIEKNKHWQNADIFVFPTYYHFETFGLVNLEAMQYSLPVVSTNEGGIPDVVEEGITGFLVPKQDVQSLADKLEILIQNPELRKKMGAAGRKKYKEQFTLNIFEKRIVEILKKSIE